MKAEEIEKLRRSIDPEEVSRELLPDSDLDGLLKSVFKHSEIGMVPEEDMKKILDWALEIRFMNLALNHVIKGEFGISVKEGEVCFSGIGLKGKKRKES